MRTVCASTLYKFLGVSRHRFHSWIMSDLMIEQRKRVGRRNERSFSMAEVIFAKVVTEIMNITKARDLVVISGLLEFLGAPDKEFGKLDPRTKFIHIINDGNGGFMIFGSYTWDPMNSVIPCVITLNLEAIRVIVELWFDQNAEEMAA